MKKTITLIAVLFLSSFIFAQKFEVIKEIPFGQPIQYYESWDPIEGGRPGILQMFSWKDNIYVFDKDNKNYININDFNDKKNYDSLYNILSYCQNSEILVLGEIPEINVYDLYITSNYIHTPNYSINFGNLKNTVAFTTYYTEDKLFSLTYNNEFVYWDLLPDGKTVFHDIEQTKKEMEDGLAERLGIVNDDGDIYFGENWITTCYPPNYQNYWDKINIVTDQYKNLESIGTYIGTDKRGIAYFVEFMNSANDGSPLENADLPIILLITAVDIWTHDAYVIALPEGDWNPPRNEEGLSVRCSYCIDDEGNVYFTDCNKKKGCYEIKKFNSDWLSQYDFYNRKVGRMNANYIPLQQQADTAADNNGFNFDNEYLWILEQGAEWCKVRKVDGREGWVQSKYIKFYDSTSGNNPSYNVAVNRIMQPNDNLRLRKQESTSSEIITTMLKGTKVKILQLGSEDTIDGIRSCWVQVEVLAGGKDKNGKEIKEGTIGWCYGGFLE